jgi:hypothetical protein
MAQTCCGLSARFAPTMRPAFHGCLSRLAGSNSEYPIVSSCWPEWPVAGFAVSFLVAASPLPTTRGRRAPRLLAIEKRQCALLKCLLQEACHEPLCVRDGSIPALRFDVLSIFKTTSASVG